MTAPTPAELDQAVIDAGRNLERVLSTTPDDQAAVDAATKQLNDANAARGYV